MRKFLVALVAIVVSLTALAQTANSRWAGTWNANMDKTKYSPGPADKAITYTVADDGKVDLHFTAPDGTSTHWSYKPELGKAAPVEGAKDMTVTRTSDSSRGYTEIWKGEGAEKSVGKGMLLKDGKTMRYVLDGTDAKGQHLHNVYIFDKQ